MEKQLKQNIASYKAKLDNLLIDHRGEVVLMKDGKVIGFHTSYEAAMRDGYMRFAHDGFFVQQVEPLPLAHEAACAH